MLKFPREEEGEKGKETEVKGKEGKERRKEMDRKARVRRRRETGKEIEWGGVKGEKKKVCKKKRKCMACYQAGNIFSSPGNIKLKSHDFLCHRS